MLHKQHEVDKNLPRDAGSPRGPLSQLGNKYVIDPATCSNFPYSFASFLCQFNFTKRPIQVRGLLGILGDDFIMILDQF